MRRRTLIDLGRVKWFVLLKRSCDSFARGGCRPRSYSWAELLRRVFSVDVLECDRCGGRMRILCAINPPDAIRKILDCLGLPSKPPPPIAPAERNSDLIEFF